MPTLRGFLWLVILLLCGEALVWALALPVSPGVIGMLLLTLGLTLRGRAGSDIQAASQPLISMLAMLIMPGVVGIFFIADEFSSQWLAVAAALLFGTLASVATTLWLMLRFMPPETTNE
ncbi:Putative effector of murein hydrolase LrgA, UPF0299 family [Franzmannia pantelleriensis]|uniref:Putative effector of murein hydrolase LrgA, UPF0299 family n=1 Tax=Franzmannia pantelleriensis TaxID=48727 RepID=A0A1G9WAC4_9GAMM|nr:CidA/LrgA family protein [Halomonas pantelleriensis]SDM80945.1 Putative effector of murein hydrolase LrgA, UPF0299 family [Halomonas pantelleriensis]